MQCVAFEVADGLAVVADAVQVAAAVIQLFQYAAVGQFGAQAVAQRVVVIAHGAALAVVDGGFADQPVEGVVGQFDAAVAVAGFDQVAAERVVVVAAAAVGFGMPVPVEAAAGLFGQPPEQVAFEAMQLQRSNRVAVVEGNGAQPVDVQTAIFGPEDARLAIRLETVAGPVQPHRDERQRQFAPGGVVHRLRQAVVAVADAAVQPVAVEDGDQLIPRPRSSNADRTEAV